MADCREAEPVDPRRLIEDMHVLVTGATGRLGKAFVPVAERAGYSARSLSRRPAPRDVSGDWAQADLASGEGVVPALSGIDTVVHLASDPLDAAAADVEGSRRLAEAARDAGVRHFVYVSIIGIDRIPFPYYRHKLAAEVAIRESGVPHSILRCAQFHYFVDLFLRRAARFPWVLPVPGGFKVQSIATEDVAEELRNVVARGPAGLLPDLAGPEVLSLAQAARVWARARGLRRAVVPVPLLGATAAAFRAGYNTSPHRPRGRETWLCWLQRRYAVASATSAV